MSHRTPRAPTIASTETDLPSEAARFADAPHVFVLTEAEREARREPADNARPPGDAHPVEHDAHPVEHEEALLLRIAGGDTAALGALWERTEDLIYANVRRILDEPSLCDTVTQGVFQDVSGMAARFDATCGDARNWLLAIAHRRAIALLSDGSINAEPVIDQRVAPRENTGSPLADDLHDPAASNGRAVPAGTQTRTQTP